MLLLVFEAQTFIFALLYQKTLVSWPWGQESWSEPGWSLANGLETLVFLVFLVQYSTFGRNDWFFWYSTAKMEVWASKTNKTVRFYWFFKTADQFYWYSTAKKKLCLESISKTTCFLLVFGNQSFIFAVLHRSEGRSLTNPWWKGQITDWSCSEALSLKNTAMRFRTGSWEDNLPKKTPWETWTNHLSTAPSTVSRKALPWTTEKYLEHWLPPLTLHLCLCRPSKLVVHFSATQVTE